MVAADEGLGGGAEARAAAGAEEEGLTLHLCLVARVEADEVLVREVLDDSDLLHRELSVEVPLSVDLRGGERLVLLVGVASAVVEVAAVPQSKIYK